MQLSEELHAKQKHEAELQEELDALRDTLQSEIHNLREVISDRDRLKTLCDEKESLLQVSSYSVATFLVNLTI